MATPRREADGSGKIQTEHLHLPGTSASVLSSRGGACFGESSGPKKTCNSTYFYLFFQAINLLTMEHTGYMFLLDDITHHRPGLISAGVL
jgi:hypothetical protein